MGKEAIMVDNNVIYTFKNIVMLVLILYKICSILASKVGTIVAVIEFNVWGMILGRRFSSSTVTYSFSFFF